jgi:hypothetical protein
MEGAEEVEFRRCWERVGELVHMYNSNYSGGRDRRTVVQSQPR